MSRSKIITMDNIKNKRNEDEEEGIVVNSKKYKNILQQISKMKQELEEKAEENDLNEIEIKHLKLEIEKLVNLCHNYKSQIKNKSIQEELMQKSIEEMKQRTKEVEEEIKTIPSSNYSKKSRQELEQLALERFNNYKKSLGEY